MAEHQDGITMPEQHENEEQVAGQESHIRWRKRADSRPKSDQDNAAGRSAASGQEGGSATVDQQTTTITLDKVAQERIAAEQAKAEDAVQRLQRTQADFANYKRRSEQEREQQAKFATLMLVTELLPVLDNFDRALSTIPESVRALPWTDGILLVDRQLRATLEKQGVTPIEAVGQRFDPMLHEAILHEDSADHYDDQIIAELQRGYMLHDKVVRPTLVKVAKNVSSREQVLEELE